MIRRRVQRARQIGAVVGRFGERLSMHHRGDAVGGVDSRQLVHHPWRAFRALAHVRLRWAHLPTGIWGMTDHASSTVTLALGLTQVERRCTIAHETQHLLRGPVPGHLQPREEVAVHRAAARTLLPDIKVVAESLAWAHNLAEAADELWVDEVTLRARLDGLHPSERAYLRQRLGATAYAA